MRNRARLKEMIARCILVLILTAGYAVAAQGDAYGAEAVCSRGDIILCEDWEKNDLGCPGNPPGWTGTLGVIGKDGVSWGVSQSDCAIAGGGIVSSPLLSLANSSRTLELLLKAGSRSSIYPETSLPAQQGATYIRWYAMWQNGFIFNGNINKHMYFMSYNSSRSLDWRLPLDMEMKPGYPTVGVPVFQIYCGYTDYPDSQCSGGEKRLYQNIGTPVDIIPGQWYEFEMMVKPDTYGTPFSGELKLWINGVLKADHTNVSVRHSTSNSPINGIMISAYYGGGGDVSPQDQRVWYDNIVVSTNYIGPIAIGSSNEVVGLIRENCTGYTNCYTSLAAWQAARGGINFGTCANGDLVCANKIAVARIEGSWTNPDTTPVVIDGWTTDTNHYVKIYTTPEARHNGKWNDAKYRLVVTTAPPLMGVIAVYTNFVRIEGLQVFMNYDGQVGASCINFAYAPYSTKGHRASNNILKGNGGTSASGKKGINAADDGYLKAWNNIIYDIKGANSSGIETKGTSYIYNNTCQNCTYGFWPYNV